MSHAATWQQTDFVVYLKVLLSEEQFDNLGQIHSLLAEM